MYFDFIRMHSGPVTNKETHILQKIWLYRLSQRLDSCPFNLDDQIPIHFPGAGRYFFHFFPASVLRSRNLTPVLLSTQHTTIKHPKSSYQHHSHRIHVWYIYLHVVDFYDKCSLIFHTWILWDSQKKSWSPSLSIPYCLKVVDRPKSEIFNNLCGERLWCFFLRTATLLRFEVLVCLENCDSQMFFLFEETQLRMFKKEFKYWFLLENPP